LSGSTYPWSLYLFHHLVALGFWIRAPPSPKRCCRCSSVRHIW
jgi:hypothetical protein